MPPSTSDSVLATAMHASLESYSEMSMSCDVDLDVDDEFLQETATARVVTSKQRRAVSPPLHLEGNPRVICYPYHDAVGAGSRFRQGNTARLQYFLPASWSPAYKFTVFEDSYILSFEKDIVVPLDCSNAETPFSDSLLRYHLARPLHTMRGDSAHSLAEFELVWPMQLDHVLLDAVQRECEAVYPGVKRKAQHSLAFSTVHLKLQKLDL